MEPFDARVEAHAAGRTGMNPLRLLVRVVVLAFAVIQVILVLRILVDLEILPADGVIADLVVPWSDALIAPVERLAGAFLGGGATAAFPVGSGIDPIVLGALAAWTIVEGFVVGVARKLARA